MLYESYIHPITILSTLPSAGVGAALALMLFHTQFDIIGTIGVILLVGIVKKNAIMMIDFAIHEKRVNNLGARDAIFQACLLRFRPIMMTTMAAILGAVPLALSFGNGGEIRRPLGISIMGGLIISQLLTPTPRRCSTSTWTGSANGRCGSGSAGCRVCTALHQPNKPQCGLAWCPRQCRRKMLPLTGRALFAI